MKLTFVVFFAMLLFPVHAFAAETAYVQSAKAKIMGEPNFKSAEAGTAKRGDKLGVLEKATGWTKVSLGPVKGWVNNLCISDSPPLDQISVVTENSADIGMQSRKRASSMTSAAASRGLTDSERKRLGEAGTTNFKALAEVEKIAGSVTDKEVDGFTPAEGRM